MNMNTTIAAIFLLGLSASSVTGYSNYNGRCSHQSYQPDSCDPNQFTVCGDSHRCVCRGDMTWIRDFGRCVYKIDNVCNRDNQGGNLPGCPPRAFCHSTTRKCTCDSKYWPKKDRSGCTNGANHSFVVNPTRLIMMVAALWTSKKILVS